MKASQIIKLVFITIFVCSLFGCGTHKTETLPPAIPTPSDGMSLDDCANEYCQIEGYDKSIRFFDVSYCRSNDEYSFEDGVINRNTHRESGFFYPDMVCKRVS